MYLSRVEVDINNRQKTRDLVHLGAYHNWVEQSFPQEIAQGIRERHLWRLDELDDHEYLLVLSADEPDLAKLEKYGVAGTAQTKSYEALLNSLHEGQQLQFRLTANPTHVVSQPGSTRGKVFPHITVEQQRGWLIKYAERSGFTLPKRGMTAGDDYAFDVVSRDWADLKHGRGHGARLSRVSFEGQLRITDVDLFKHTLMEGLGREKAYGMGLLTVIPEAK